MDMTSKAQYQKEYRAANAEKHRAYCREYYKANKERLKEYHASYREEKKDERRACMKRWLASKGDSIREYRKATYAKHRSKILADKKRAYMKNKPAILERHRAYHHKQQASSPAYRIRRSLRARLHHAIRDLGGTRKASTMSLLGCDADFLKSYLEARFLPGMTWKNYGEWHIDHRIPCASFDLTILDEQSKCFHYSNLQPLWGVDNMAKGDKCPGQHQAGTA